MWIKEEKSKATEQSIKVDHVSELHNFGFKDLTVVSTLTDELIIKYTKDMNFMSFVFISFSNLYKQEAKNKNRSMALDCRPLSCGHLSSV